MKFSGPLQSQRLSVLLEMAISREAQMWKVYLPRIQPNQDAGISPTQRDEVIQWLAKLRCQFHLYPETLSLAVCLLDRFLAAVKARPKYLNCIAISCFFLATKTIEEDEKIPVLKILARDSFCGCSPAEIRRMEKIILDKLNWDLHTATPLDFLHIFHAVALSTRPQLLTSLPKVNPSQHVALLTKHLLHCLACYQLLQFKGSMLALAIVSLEVEKLIPDWLALIIELLHKAQMDSSQLIHCRELISKHLSTLQPPLLPNSVYVYSPLKHNLVTCPAGAFRFHAPVVPVPDWQDNSNSKLVAPAKGSALLCRRRRLPPGRCKPATAKRKVEEMEVDDFYDGIKRLYNEENPLDGGEGKAAPGCGVDVPWQGGSISPCPPLQPVSVM
ncbi:cyclin-I [Pseudonaja textilis]|uniref:Cyclin-I n=1 Tax=Pseudonaja textilis TaxID=8673 RepID=A0A670ZUP1_PSETE|nr:cyclin-I [Pseudonaja textilis]XP_026572974.1 cyclin-I [Pseudonaja textilis]XP_026572975.1 cyclin-I [Pseudonaja textilis]XP_026572976.1 cyclin-I [Pseudonaja textilis]